MIKIIKINYKCNNYKILIKNMKIKLLQSRIIIYN